MAIIEVSQNALNSIGILTRKLTDGTELDMVKKFIEFRKSTFVEKPDKQLAIFIEPKINNAYPDIIFTEYNPRAYERWNTSRNSLDLSDLKVLNYIQSMKKTTSEDIVQKLVLNYKNLLFSIEKLCDAGLIYRISGYWAISNNDFFGIRKVASIEAKISKWNEVFQQALLNKNFSSESSVLMKLKGDPRNNIYDSFQDFGIGLYVYNDKGFSIVKKPRQKGIPMNYHSLYINEWIGRTLHNTEA